MSTELKKRIFTSFFLLLLLALMFFYTFVLIISIITIAVIAWIELHALISKIFNKKKIKDKSLRFICKAIFLVYLFFLIYLILIMKTTDPNLSVILIYSIFISIMSDIGGLFIGKIFKGRKLSKISPNKTISGSLGSFIFSLLLVPFFYDLIPNHPLQSLLLFTIIISLTSQLGDLFISLAKRSANVKNTSDLLPGHGGVLDRIDGIIFAIPMSFLLFTFF